MAEIKFNIPPIHVHLHGTPSDSEALGRIEKSLATLVQAAARTLQTEGRIQMTVDDILAKSQAVMDQTKKNGDLEASIIAIVNHNSDTIKDLQKQLADAGTDPAKLQQVADQLDAILKSETSNADAVAAAVTANTPAS
jgi:hypothetical protein